MNRIGRALIFIGQVVLFLAALALIVIASILLYVAFIYALTLIGIPEVVAQFTWIILCLFVCFGRQYERYYIWIKIDLGSILFGVQSHITNYASFLYRGTSDMVAMVIWMAWAICADHF